MKRKYQVVAHMQQNHRLDSEVSDSSDSELDQAEPVQVSTELRRLGVTTKKASQLSGTKHADLDNLKPTQPSHHDPKPKQPSHKDPPSHHDLKPTQPNPKNSPSRHEPKPTQPSPKNPPSHHVHPKPRQLSIKNFLIHEDDPGLGRPPHAAPSDRMQRISETSANFASLPRKHRAGRRQATAANKGSDENDQRLQNRGATSALITSSTPTKKRRRVLNDGCNSAFNNPPKRLKPNGQL